MTAILEWRQEPFRWPPGIAWRLYADDATLAAIGGAPCFNHSASPGQIAYVTRDNGVWSGHAELTPYHPITTPRRARAETAKTDVLAAVERHLAEIKP